MLGMTVGTIYQKKYVTDGDLISGGFWQYVAATVVMVTLSASLETQVVTWSTDFIIALAWLIIALSIGAVFLLMILIREGAVSQVASLFYLVPVATALEGAYLFGETLTWLQIAGMVLTAVAVAIATAGQSASAKPARASR
jgi:drug/metabolite transporter (DMT)-like permease